MTLLHTEPAPLLRVRNVSVRFEHRADGLAVALASPDPDFARAVQAATPAPDSGGSGGGSDMARNAPGGQSGTPFAATTPGHGGPSSQGQRGSQPAQSDRTGPDPQAATGLPATSGTDAPARPRGIYA